MKKLMVLVMLLLLIGTSAASVMAKNGHGGPAPNSGDGVSDGSGRDSQNGPHSDRGKSSGSAPNSGDGISDGSGR